jgi:hypothetical protein
VADAPPLSASSPAGGVAGAVGHDPFEEFKRKRR